MSDAPFLEPRGLPLRIAAIAWRGAHTGLAELLAPIARFLLAAVRLLALLLGFISLWTVATYGGPHQAEVVGYALLRAVLLGLVAFGVGRLRGGRT